MQIAPQSFAFTILLGLFAALPALSIDVSAPTLAILPAALGTTRTLAGLTLSLFMVGFACGQLGGGVLSDKSGRRPVLLAGLVCFTAAGIACALAPSGSALAVARLVQGLGAGTCFVISFAMVQDLFEGNAARAKRSYVTVIFGAVPMIAPATGSVLMQWFGWRSVHWSLAFAGAVLLAVTWTGIAESKIAIDVLSVRPKEKGAMVLWQDSGFVRIAMANALSYGAIFAYIAGSPVVIIGQMGLSTAVFAAVFASTAGALTAGAWTSGRLSRKGIGAVSLLNRSLVAGALATGALAAVTLAGTGAGLIVIPLLLAILYSRGVSAPNLQHIAIDRHRERSGVASAAVGVSQLLSGALASALVAYLLQSFGPAALAMVMALFAGGALLTWRGAVL